MLYSFFYFILALIILITIHEFGHFIVARMCGVKVLRFSFGFGKVLFSVKDKLGTEYAWSLFPLGGYVKMLDESEGYVPPKERHLAFNRKSVFKRIAIVIAGPLFNFIFAFVALWLVLVIGIKSIAPIIAEVHPESMGQKIGLEKGQEIVAFDNKKIRSWRDFQFAIVPVMGKTDFATMVVKTKDNQFKTISIPLFDWEIDSKKPDILKTLGITPFIPLIPPVVGEVVINSPAEKAGLKKGDVIISLNNKPTNDWIEFAKFIKEHPNTKINLKIARNSIYEPITVYTNSVREHGKDVGVIGVKSEKIELPKNWVRIQKENPLSALGVAFNQTITLTKATFILMGRLVIGKLPMASVSGPIGIAQGAGGSARGGLSYYLAFLALVSISLGVLNLLPIPVLDGGHLLYYVIEVVTGKPLSERMQIIGTYIGLFLLAMVMSLAISNDLIRIFS